MRLHTETVEGRTEDAVEWVNQKGIARIVTQMIYSPMDNTTDIIMRFDSYPDYIWACGKLGITHPMSTSEFFA